MGDSREYGWGYKQQSHGHWIVYLSAITIDPEKNMFQDSSLSAPCLAGPILVERMVNAWMLFTNNPWWLSHNPHDHVILKSFCWARVLGSKAFRVWTRMAWLRLLLKITKKTSYGMLWSQNGPKRKSRPRRPGDLALCMSSHYNLYIPVARQHPGSSMTSSSEIRWSFASEGSHS